LFGSFLPSLFWLVCTTKVYSGVGADIVMESIMAAVGAYRPVDDALRIAFTELVARIHEDYGLSDLDGYELLGKVAKIHLTEMVDPNYVVVASVEKKYLPPRKK